MKKIIGLFLLLFLMAGMQEATAQEMKEANITIGITDLKVDDPSAAAQIGMIKTATLNIAFNEEQSLFTGEAMGGMMKARFLFNANPKNLLMLVDAMGQKTMTKFGADDFKEFENMAKDMEEKNQDDKLDYDISYDKSVTKNILGYDCYKANVVVNNEEAKDANLVISFFVTDAIKYPKSMLEELKTQLKDFDFTKVILEATISGGEKGKGGSITLAATKIEESVNEEVFNLDTTGYETMEVDELKKAAGGM